MKIKFYSESPDPGPGGAEQFIAVLAEALSGAHEVCIVHHKTEESAREWGAYAGCDLSRVKFRHVPRMDDDSLREKKWWRRYRAAKLWRRELSEECDLFIALLHNRPPFCQARRGVMIVLFPTYQPAREGILDPPVVRKFYQRWEWKRRVASYSVKLSISDFSRRWTRARWGFGSELLHPPVALPPNESTAKENCILSVGRFATTGHTKKQLELLQMFAELRRDLPGWSYSNVGGLNDWPNDRIYFERCSDFRDGTTIAVEANVERAELDRLYDRAKIFWHAAGLGDDHERQPEMAEHFGLVTVEAMAHGCVPIVIRLGGQPEIVEHGVSGFLFDSLGELAAHTRTLAHDPALLARMSVAARKRAQLFSREACVANLRRYLKME
ncbi:MAG: glycosyltransferase family 4 protein [Verrucomicrobiota bacterium]|nr:glycosyltransferase family 4 protein [Verrucomicrobiota bacterium]